MLKNKLFLGITIFLSFFVYFASVFSVSAQTIEISNNETWNEDKIIEGSVIVNSGVTLTLAKGVSLTFKGAESGISVHGKLVVKGTVVNPVKFDLEGDISEENFYGITAHNGGEIFMTNAEVENGGYYYVPSYGFFEKIRGFFLKNILAVYNTGAIGIEDGGKMEAEHCFFHNNKIGVAVYWGESYNESDVKINRSKFENNSPYDIVSSADVSMNFEYNWWGSEDGPDRDRIYGDIDAENYIEEENFHDPVIIVPGILGSQEINGKWIIDPVWHTYDNLYKEFTDNGYVSEKDLFTFGYDWEKSNIESAELLKIKIQEIKTANNWPKVDIVAHSMGGLLTREYIESENYADDIDQLITLGTPQNGAPEAYLKWDGDAWFWGGSDLYAKRILDQKVEESAGQYADRFDYIHQKPVSSLEQLLPIYNYLQDVENNYEYEIYPSGYPKNEFLENLNQTENIAKLRKVEFDKIIGKVGSDTGTIAGFKIINADMGKFWDHGYPLGFEIPIGDRGLIKGDGDRTVPYESAKSENIPADEYMEINSVHRNLPTDAQKDVLEFLTGIRPENENRDSMIKDILITSVFSPIDIQIIAPNGQWTGKNINNLDEDEQIDGAYYSGYETENEFLTVPNPENGEYKIIMQGTGDGEYRIEIAKISEDDSGVASEISGEIIGTAENGIQEEKTVEVLEEEIVTEEKDIVPPTITIDSPQNKSYQSDEIVPIEFTTADDSSGIDEEKTEIFLDEEIFSQDKIDMAYLTKGEHNLKISAMDKAGNFQEETITFSIQPTIDSIMENVDHYYADKLITKKAAKNYLDAKLKIIKMQKMFYEAIRVSPWPANFKNRLLKNLARNINREIENLIDDIQNKKSISKNILESAKSILIGNLGEIKV